MLKNSFLLDPQVVFLNHGSFGACPRPVFEQYQAWQRQLELQPVQFLWIELDNYLHHARQKLGEYLNASTSDLVYIPNATHGVNIVARSLQLNPGDEILSTDQEYGACNFAWEFVCNKTGALFKQLSIVIPVTSEEEIADQFWRGVTPHTKIIFISHITSPTSLTMPVEMICQRARQAGILTLIDGAHAPGQMPVDLDAIQADFYVGNCHKWMLSPKGSGFIYARPEVQNLIEPLIVSWGYQSRFTNPRESRFVDYLQWSGTKDPAAALTVPTAIDFMKTNHWDDVRDACHHLLGLAMGQICDITGLSPLYPLGSDFYHQMCTIPIPIIRDINELKSRLYTEYKIEIPCIEWNQHHFLRLSVQGYNTADDIEQLVNALRILLPTMMAA
ncbi:MAG: aminotransferase class V [Chloroflexi bacterium RBG_16_47_49]|nr:MAG: aminotransferase class V [Chloroflexi bacterium RBG_16_47_49]